MEIVQAIISDFDDVFRITQSTINEIYPHYYPLGAVSFFSSHHNRLAIEQDIESGRVWILRENAGIGTVTIKENEIARLFVLPEYQGKRYGSKLMDFAENIIFHKYQTIVLDASFPAQEMYIKRGYKALGFYKILCENGDYLCYSEMIFQKIIS